MAIKVGGTTVIDDSRNFTNIAGGFKTVNGTSVVGSGDISAGASTTAGAVGTYMFARRNTASDVAFGSTAAGSSLLPASATYSVNAPYYDVQLTGTGPTQSGTWRCMGYYDYSAYSNVSHVNGVTSWVRIS